MESKITHRRKLLQAAAASPVADQERRAGWSYQDSAVVWRDLTEPELRPPTRGSARLVLMGNTYQETGSDSAIVEVTLTSETDPEERQVTWLCLVLWSASVAMHVQIL